MKKATKISSKVDEAAWNDLRALARESHQNISGLLSEAIREYVARRRVRPIVMKHLEGRSYEEMAQLAGVGVDALKMRVHRARDTLRVILRGLDESQ